MLEADELSGLITARSVDDTVELGGSYTLGLLAEACGFVCDTDVTAPCLIQNHTNTPLHSSQSQWNSLP